MYVHGWWCCYSLLLLHGVDLAHPVALEHRVRVVPSTLAQARTKRWRLKHKPSLWGMVATLLVLMYATN